MSMTIEQINSERIAQAPRISVPAVRFDLEPDGVMV